MEQVYHKHSQCQVAIVRNNEGMYRAYRQQFIELCGSHNRKSSSCYDVTFQERGDTNAQFFRIWTKWRFHSNRGAIWLVNEFTIRCCYCARSIVAVIATHPSCTLSRWNKIRIFHNKWFFDIGNPSKACRGSTILSTVVSPLWTHLIRSQNDILYIYAYLTHTHTVHALGVGTYIGTQATMKWGNLVTGHPFV